MIKTPTMSFLRDLSQRWPMPSVRDLESSHFELQNDGPYPESEAYDDEKAGGEVGGESKLEQRASATLDWLGRVFARSPKAINAKREALLPSSSDCGSERSSTDAESQSSTLLEVDEEAGRKTPRSARIDARVVSDAIIGLSDGLTVPFALTAGLSALGNTQVVIFAGLAELTAGAISMGLGGYLGAKSEE